MKITIEHSRTKRQINGALNVLGNREDLLWLAKKIYDEAKKRDFKYGWITIEQKPIEQPSIANTPVEAWD